MKPLETIEEFTEKVNKLQEDELFPKEVLAWSVARVDKNETQEKKLQATFPLINFDSSNLGSLAIWLMVAKEHGIDTDSLLDSGELMFDITPEMVEDIMTQFKPFLSGLKKDEHFNIQVAVEVQRYLREVSSSGMKSPFSFVILTKDVQVKALEAAYLKLQLLSEGLVPAGQLNLDGIFGILPNVAWSGNQPFDLDDLRNYNLQLKVHGKFPCIDFVDRFPRYLQHIIPADTTYILDTSKVLLGEQLVDGDRVMPSLG